MTPEDLSAYIDETEKKAAGLARQAVRALERFISGRWDGDFDAYCQWQADALLLLWRLARIREAGRSESWTDGPIPDALATRIRDFQGAHPTWDPDALVRSMVRPPTAHS